MIKLQDFARQQGVTDRAIQKHLKTYAAELEGLYQRKGPNGTWLTDEACEILRSKMKQAPVTVFDVDPRVEKLEARVKELEEKLDEKDKMLTLSQQTVQEAQKQVNLLLEENRNVKLLEAQNGDLSAEIKKRDKLLEDKEKELQELKNASLMKRLFGWKKTTSHKSDSEKGE